MLSPEEAQQAAEFWREKFQVEGNFDRSWHKFFEMVGKPSAGGLESWLMNDQLRDAAEARGVRKEPPKEPLLPVQSTYAPNDCSRCSGRQYLRREVPVGHPDFGRALACPDCNGA